MKNAPHFHERRIKVFMFFAFIAKAIRDSNLEFIFHYIIIHNITLANIELYRFFYGKATF